MTTRVWITAKVNYATEVRAMNRMVMVLINASRKVIDNCPSIEECLATVLLHNFHAATSGRHISQYQ